MGDQKENILQRERGTCIHGGPAASTALAASGLSKQYVLSCFLKGDLLGLFFLEKTFPFSLGVVTILPAAPF